MDPKAPKKGTVWRATKTPWRNVQGVSWAEGEQGDGSAFDAGPCSHVYLNSTEVCGGTGYRFYERKSAIHIAWMYGGRKKNVVGEHFWARGIYYVSTAGKDEEAVREYIELSVPGIGYLVERGGIIARENCYKLC